MATRKKKLDLHRPLDTSWSEPWRELGKRVRGEDEETVNREARAAAIVEAIAADNPDISDAQLAQIFDRMVKTGNFDVAVEPAPDFSNVQSGADSLPADAEGEAAPQGYWQERFGELRRGLAEIGDVGESLFVNQRLGAASGELAAARAEEADLWGTRNTSRIARPTDIPNFGRYGSLEEREAAEAERLRARVEEAKATVDSLAPRAKALRERLETGSLGTLTAEIPEGLAGAAQVEQALPIAGAAVGGLVAGPGGAVAGAVVGSLSQAKMAYEGAYFEARDLAQDEEGNPLVTHEEAQAYAAAITGIEFGMDALGGLGVAGAAKLAGAFGLKGSTKGQIKEQLARRVRGRMARAGLGAAAEGGTELATFGAQRAVDELAGALDVLSDPEANAALDKHNLEARETWARDARISVIGGAGIGGTTAGGMGALSYVAELGAQEAQTRRRMLEESFGRRRSLDQQQPAPMPETQPDMFGTPDGLPTAEEYEALRRRQAEEDAAWRVRQNERAEQERTDNRKALRENMVRRADDAAERVEWLQERVDAGDTSSGTLNSLAQAQRDHRNAVEEVNRFDEMAPEPVQEAPARVREEETAPVQEDLVEQSRAAENERLARVLKQEQDKKARAAKRDEQKRAKEQASTERARQREAARQVLEENPGKDLSDPTLVEALRKKLEQPVDTEAKRLADKAGAVRNRLEGSKKSKLTRAENNRLSALVKNNPEATNEQIASMFQEQQQVDQRTTKPDAKVTEEDTEADIRRMAEEQGILGMAADGDAGEASTSDADFIKKASTILHNVARRNTDDTAAVQNLIRQGKMVLVPNAASIGRTASDNLGIYSVDEGTIYLYTDNLNPADAVGTMIVAAHEAGHLGQLNPREGRNSLLDSLLGDVPGAANKIRAAANAGDKRAQAAVNAVPENTLPEQVDYEVAAYLIGQAFQNRNTPLGRLRGVVGDAVAGGRKILRDNLGVNLDVNLDDLISASRLVLQEAVQTDTAGQRGGEDMAIVAGARGAGADFAEAEGRSWNGSVDGLFRYEIPDIGAEVDSGLLGRLKAAYDKDGTARVRLGNLLKHSVLYSNYPELKDVNVFVKDLGYAWAQYDPKTNSISISPTVLDYAVAIPDAQSIWSDSPEMTNMEFLRNMLLHETQHAVQNIEGFVPGTTDQNFIPKPVKDALESTRKKLDDVINKFDLGLAEQTLPPYALRAWRNEVSVAGLESRDAKAELFLAEEYYEDSTDRRIKRYGPQYKQAFEDWVAAKAAYDTAQLRADEMYKRDAGELEARTVESRSRKTPEELAATPFEQDTVNARDGLPIEQALDTTPYSGGRNLPAMAQGSDLAMADRVEGTNAPRSVPREALSTKEVIKRIIMTAIRAQAADIKDAEHLDRHYRKAIELDLGTRDPTPEQHKEILDALQNVENADPQARQKLWDNFAKKYPNLAPVLDTMRQRIDNNSVALVRERLASNIPLTKEEIRQFGAVLRNRGRYLTRAYAAFQGQEGRAWRETRWDNFSKYLGDYLDTERRGRLNKRQLEDVEAVYNAIEFMKSKYAIPADDVLQDMPMRELEDLYRDHGGVLDRLITEEAIDSSEKRDALVNALAQRREALTKEQLDNMATRAIQGLLGITPDMPHYARTLTALAKDPGTLKKKDFVPDEIRRVLGEMTNPAARVLSTLSTQASLMARQGVYLDFLNDHMGELVVPASDIDLPGVREKLSAKPTDSLSERILQGIQSAREDLGGPAARPRGPVLLEGAEYGPLQGHYVHPQVADALVASVETFNTFAEAVAQFNEKPAPLAVKAGREVGKITGGATRLEKITGVVYNPARAIANYAGSSLQIIANGNLTFSGGWRGHVTARDYIASAARGGTTELLQDAHRYIGLEAADIGDIQRILGNSIKDYMDGVIGDSEVRGKLQEALSATGRAGRAAHRTAAASYAVMDNWTKVANYYDRLNTLQAYYAIVDPGRSKERIKEEAGNTTNYTNISYERVPKALKDIEGFGATKFVPYFYEAFRTRITNYNQALLDFKRAAATSDPEAARIMMIAGAKRAIGNTLAIGLMPGVGFIKRPVLHTTVAFGLLAAAGSDDDYERLRRMMSDFTREQDLLNFGQDPDGNPVYLSISDYFDPYGPSTDMLRILINTPKDELPGAFKDKIIEMMITPSWIRNGMNLVAGRDLPPAVSAQAFPAMVTKMQEVGAMLGADAVDINNSLRFLEGWLPGWLKTQTAATMPNIVNNDEAQALATAMSRAGFRFETLNPQRQLNIYGYESSQAKQENRKRLNGVLTATNNLTNDRLDEIAIRYGMAELDRLQEAYKNVQSLRAWGYDDAQIAAALKATKGNPWSKAEIAMLMSGHIQPTLSIKSFMDAAENRLKGMDPEMAEDYRARAQAAIDKLFERKAHLEELGFIVEEK